VSAPQLPQLTLLAQAVELAARARAYAIKVVSAYVLDIPVLLDMRHRTAAEEILIEAYYAGVEDALALVAAAKNAQAAT
jgi:hypothetical protein